MVFRPYKSSIQADKNEASFNDAEKLVKTVEKLARKQNCDIFKQSKGRGPYSANYRAKGGNFFHCWGKSSLALFKHLSFKFVWFGNQDSTRRFLGMTKMPLLPIGKLPEVSSIGQFS